MSIKIFLLAVSIFATAGKKNEKEIRKIQVAEFQSACYQTYQIENEDKDKLKTDPCAISCRLQANDFMDLDGTIRLNKIKKLNIKGFESLGVWENKCINEHAKNIDNEKYPCKIAQCIVRYGFKEILIEKQYVEGTFYNIIKT